MRLVFAIMSLVGGLVVVGALMLLQSVMRAWHPDWTLPFSAWWGLVLVVPGLAGAARRNF